MLIDRVIPAPPGPAEIGVFGEVPTPPPKPPFADDVKVIFDIVELIPVLMLTELGNPPERLFVGAEPDENEVLVEPVLRRFRGGAATSGEWGE
jgi:hypothetical protein